RILAELDANEKRHSTDEAHLMKALIKLYLQGDMQYLNYYGQPGHIRTLSYHQALALAEGPYAVHEFGGKAAFIGLSEFPQMDRQDNHVTVFSVRNEGLDFSGVEIAATAFANLLHDSPVRQPALIINLALLFLWGTSLGAVCRLPSLRRTTIVAIGAALAYGTCAVYLFATQDLWLPLVIPLTVQAPLALGVTVLTRYRNVRREREHIRRAFGHYLPGPVVEQLAKSLADVTAANRLVYGTCVATDAERYTTIAEGMDPIALARLMNDYYQAIFVPVERLGGFISDVVGDAAL